MNEKIFISISACNEKDLLQTVLSAINNSYYPDRLSFGIFEHRFDEKFTNFSNIKQKMFHAKVMYGGPLGVGHPRMNATLLSDRNQDFILQIDAHMIFEKNWDVDLIHYYSLISQKHSKPIISSYVPWWFEDADGFSKPYVDDSYIIDTNNFYGIDGINTSKLAVEDFEKSLFKKCITITGENVDWSNNKQYEEHYGISGHFLFTSFDFIEQVLHDPFIPWDGDQLVVGMRAWTRGYKIFTIPKRIVWHKNKWGPDSSGINVISLDKSDWRIYENSTDKFLYETYSENSILGFKRIKDILLGDYIGYWGAPDIILLEEYQNNLGVRFKDYYDMLKTYLKNNDEKTFKVLYE